jgi:rSAM/selenodomain-associated transferase 1
MTALLVLAKEPVPGRVKTRLCPPCSHEQAAALAEAALADTLLAVASTPARRRVLVLAGRPGPWLPPGFEVLPQRGCGLDDRLAAAFQDVGEPAVLIGMDTPQVTPALLERATAALERSQAVLGPAADGGFWAMGLRRADRRAFAGVPMSREITGHLQARRLREMGLATSFLPTLRDVDTIDDARVVARLAPGTGFARQAREVLTPPAAALLR